MEWVGCIRCEKFQNDFTAQTCALIALVQPVLQRVSCINETLPNAPKHYETHQNMSLGCIGVDPFRSLRKILMRLHGTHFCISCTCSARFVSSIVQSQNNPKCIQTLHSLQKIPKRLHGTNLCINCTSSTRFVMSFV